MLFQIEQRLQQLLAPYKDAKGVISRSKCPDAIFPTLETEIKKIIKAGFDWAERNNISRSAIYRKWTLTCHPDKGAINKNFEFDGKLVCSGKLMSEIDQLFSPANPLIQNNGQFVNLVNEGYHNQGEQALLSNFTVNNFYAEFENLLFKHNVISVVENSFRLKHMLEFIYIKQDENAYFTGTLLEWLKYELRNRIYEALEKEQNKPEAINKLKAQIQGSLIQQLFNRSDDTANLFQEALSATFNDAQQLVKPEAPHYLSAGDAMIKYQIHVGLAELHKPFRHPDSMNSHRIFPRGFFNSSNTNYCYDTSVVRPYYEYEMLLSLWNALYADPDHAPNFTDHRSQITQFATREYTQRQYDTLCKLFNENAEPEFLARFGLVKAQLYFINEKLTSNKSFWNHLQETSNWLYAHGPHSPLSQPWAVIKDGRHRPKDFYEVYIDTQINRFENELGRHPQVIAIERFPSSISNFIICTPPILMLASMVASAFEFIEYLGLIGTIGGSMWVIPLCPIALGMGFAFSESFLDNIARLSKPVAIPVYNPSLPEWTNQLISQIMTPLKRILLSPIDEYYTHKTKYFLKLLYPLRVAFGLGLAIASSVALVGFRLTEAGAKGLILAYLSIFNLWFDYPVYFASLRQLPRNSWNFLSQLYQGIFKKENKPKPDLEDVPNQEGKYLQGKYDNDLMLPVNVRPIVPLRDQRSASVERLREQVRHASEELSSDQGLARALPRKT